MDLIRKGDPIRAKEIDYIRRRVQELWDERQSPDSPVPFDRSKIALGHRMLQAKVRIYAGFIEHHNGDATDYHAVSEEDVSISSDNYNVVYLQWTVGTSTYDILVNNGASESAALNGVDDDETNDYLRIPLVCTYYNSSAVHHRLIRIYHEGNVKILPIFAE